MGPGGSTGGQGLRETEPAEDLETLRAKWDQRHGAADVLPEPPLVLREYEHLLPAPGPSPAFQRGEALDLACGLGAGALWLARRRYHVSAWDLSPVAMRRLSTLARERRLPVVASVRNLISAPPPPEHFDLILVAHFLDRGLCPAIARALRPGGLLFYQTFSREAVSDRGPPNPAYRLGPNELLDLFRGLVVRAYRDEGRLGDLGRGTRDLALLVAQRAVEDPGG